MIEKFKLSIDDIVKELNIKKEELIDYMNNSAFFPFSIAWLEKSPNFIKLSQPSLNPPIIEIAIGALTSLPNPVPRASGNTTNLDLLLCHNTV